MARIEGSSQPATSCSSSSITDLSRWLYGGFESIAISTAPRRSVAQKSIYLSLFHRETRSSRPRSGDASSVDRAICAPGGPVVTRPEAPVNVVVDHADVLHEGVYARRAKETEPTFDRAHSDINHGWGPFSTRGGSSEPLCERASPMLSRRYLLGGRPAVAKDHRAARPPILVEDA